MENHKKFKIKNGVLTKYLGKENNIIIPEGVIKIDNSVFADNLDIKTLTLPKTLKKINDNAFSKCVNLTKINGLENVKEIGNYAFYKCGIEEIFIKNTDGIFVGFSAFEQCEKIKKIEIDKAINISEDAFKNCISLKEIIMNIERFGIILKNCTNLEKITIKNKLQIDYIPYLLGINNCNLTEVIGPNIVTENGVVYNKNRDVLIYYLENKIDKFFKVPDNIEVIGEYAFDRNKYLEKLELGKNVKIIDNSSINCKNLKEIIFNDKIEKLYDASITLHNDTTINLRNTNINTYDIDNIICSKATKEKIKIILPKKIECILTHHKTLNEEDKNIELFTSNKNVNIIGSSENVKFIRLDELLGEGKTFREANQTIKEYER